MEATLKFNLPEEREDHLLAVRAGDMAAGVADAMEQTRCWLKHGHDFKTADEAIEACRALLADAAGIARGE